MPNGIESAGTPELLEATGRRLKLLREYAGISQARAAEIAQCSQSAVAKWELGQRSADPYAVGRICEQIGVTLDFVFLGKRSGITYSLAEQLGRMERKMTPEQPRPAGQKRK